MFLATFEVRVRLDMHSKEEARAVLDARYKLLNIPGALSVVQIGPVDDTSKIEWLENGRPERKEFA